MTEPKALPVPHGKHPNSRKNLQVGGNHRQGDSTPRTPGAPRKVNPASLKNLLPGGAHRKGVSTKTTRLVRDVIHMAFEAIPTEDGSGEGFEAFKEWATANKSLFYASIWPKLLPLQVTGEGGGAIQVQVLRFTPEDE